MPQSAAARQHGWASEEGLDEVLKEVRDEIKEKKRELALAREREQQQLADELANDLKELVKQRGVLLAQLQPNAGTAVGAHQPGAQSL
jgi:flagellar biosynthesis/type III secretory pathway chaperone